MLPVRLDATDAAALRAQLQQHRVDAVVSSLPYHCNPLVGAAAREAGVHYFDLTEDVEVTRRVAALAREAPQAFVPQCGLAPGFISIHSHAQNAALPTAVNMLTQGVTTEIVNADGGGSTDIAKQLATSGSAGFGVNVGADIGFNSVWAEVVGMNDRRPTPVARLRRETL